MHKGKLKYAEICPKHAVPNMQEIYTNMQMKNMQCICKISSVHKYAFNMQMYVLYV